MDKIGTSFTPGQHLAIGETYDEIQKRFEFFTIFATEPMKRAIQFHSLRDSVTNCLSTFIVSTGKDENISSGGGVTFAYS